VSLLGRLSVAGAGRPPGTIPEEELLRAARRERTLPVVARNLGRPCAEEAGILGRQILAAAQARELAERVELLPLKGLHLAHRLYPSPALRDMGDLDVLVRAPDVSRADAALRSLGYRSERPPAPRPGALLNAGLYLRDDGLPLHLHWHVLNASLPHGPVRIDAEEIWREARDGAMAPQHLFLTLCEHALKHSYDALVHLTDLELASRGLDWDRTVDAARRWGLERPVSYALLLLRDVMGVRSPGLKRFPLPAPGPEGSLVLAMARSRRARGVSALGRLSLLRGLAGKLAYVRDALAPPVGEGLSTRTAAGRAARALAQLGS
jgi:hypothetical protein